MSHARYELLVKEVYRSNFIWQDLEELFSINKKILQSEFAQFISSKENPEYKLNCFEKRMKKNERIKRALSYKNQEREKKQITEEPER